MNIEYVRFAIVDRPVCIWSPNLAAENLRFLRTLDPDYLLYEAAVHQQAFEQAPDDASRLRAAMALRTSYGVALESLFAFLAASAQAPDCIFGWLTLYRLDELKTFVTRMLRSEAIRVLPPFRPPTWRRIAEVLLGPLETEDATNYSRQVERFSEAWAVLAADFLNDTRSREYNSLKHGIRTQPGAFSLEFSTETEGVFYSAENALGHSFVLLEPKQGRKHHHDLKFVAMGLEPENCSAALMIIAVSIHNALAFARARASDKSELQVRSFTDDLPFETLRKHEIGVSSFTLGGTASPTDESEYWSRQEILAIYDDQE